MSKLRIADKKNILYSAAAFIIPAFIMLLCLVFIHAAPFGNNSLIFRDANGQYLDFLSYARTLISGENDLFYSFAKGMGGNLLSLAAYYLMSPFTLLFAFASDGSMPLMFEIVVILKIACCGLSFYFVSSKIYGAKPSLLMFSTAYALMAYNIVYEWNIMWLDGPMILPIIFLGIHRIWTEKKYGLYIAALFYGLFSNYYIGYMLCACSVLICLSMLTLREGWDRKEKLTVTGKYLLSSCIAGFGTAFMWLPAFAGISSDRGAADASKFNLELLYEPLDILSKLSPGAISPADLFNGLPNIFCTTAVLFLVILFFLNKSIDKKKKLIAAALSLIMLLSFNINFFNLIWHGLTAPNGFNYRNSFIFSFIMIMIAQYQFCRGGSTEKKQAAIAAVILLAIYGYVYLRGEDIVSYTGLLLSMLCTAGIFVILAAESRLRFSAALLAALCILESSANAAVTLKKMTDEVGSMNMGSHYQTVDTSKAALDYVKSMDQGFYRMEKAFRRSHNDAMFFDYNGLTHFSSTDKGFVMDFLGRMGLRDNDIWAYFQEGSTNEAEALLGVKYIIGGEDISAFKNYEIIHDTGETQIYQNLNALPLAFMSDRAILDVDMEKKDLFMLHNDIWSGITGEEQQLLLPEENFSLSMNNLSMSINEDGDRVYRRVDMEAPASLCYEITVSQAKPLYYYFTSPLVQANTVSINGVDDGQYFWLYRWNMANVGVFKPGEKVKLEINALGEEIVITGELFYYEDLEKLTEITDKIKEQETELIKEKSSKLRGRVSAGEDGLMIFSIPYDEGWTLKVDGEETELIMAMDALMAAEIEAGEHSFTLTYRPAGLNAGIALSIGAALTAALWYMLKRKRK